MLRAWWALLMALVLVSVLACGTDSGSEPGPSTPGGDPASQWALGGKADGGACEPAADLCWPTALSTAMREVMAAQDRLLLDETDAREGALALVGGLAALDVKLTVEERSALAELEVSAQGMATDAAAAEREAFVGSVQAGILERLVGTYVAAYVVPVGAKADATLKGAADDPSGLSEELPEVGLSEGMRESLDMLRAAGVFGKLYAFLFEHTGILDREYPLFDEAFPFSEPREERLERIIERRQLVAARDAAISGAESLIPVAGIVVSFSHRKLLDFRNKMRLGIEIASLYGIDIREGQNLFLVATTIMEVPGLTKYSAGSFAVRFLIKLAVKKGLGISVKEATKAFMGTLASKLLTEIGFAGADAAAKAAASGAAASVGNQILGFATFGLVILVDAGVSAHVIDKIGRRADAYFRPWGVGMMEGSGRYLTTPEARACAALVAGNVMKADGVVTTAEKQLLAAHLAKAWFTDNGWFVSTASDVQARASAAAAGGATKDCVEDELRKHEHEERLAVLELALTMSAVDGDRSASERALTDALLEDIRDDGFLDSGLDDDHLEAQLSMVDGLLVHPETLVPATQQDFAASTTAGELLPFLAVSRPAEEAAIACAFDGACN